MTLSQFPPTKNIQIKPGKINNKLQVLGESFEPSKINCIASNPYKETHNH